MTNEKFLFLHSIRIVSLDFETDTHTVAHLIQSHHTNLHRSGYKFSLPVVSVGQKQIYF